MTASSGSKTDIRTLFLTPGVTVWYCQIMEITHSIFSKTSYHNSRPLVNEIFQKADFKPDLFNRNELIAVNGFKAFKKQLEWLSGRFLVKSMIQDLFLPHTGLDDISLGALDEGAPFVIQMPDLPVSLSHSYDYTAAAVCRDRTKTLGLDIEKIREKPDDAFMNTAFTKEEIRHMPDDAFSVFTHWTVKEAYLKYIKRGFNESLHKVEVIDNTIRHHGRPVDLTIQSVKIAEDYVLSLVCD